LLAPHAISQTRGPPLGDCPLLHMQYIRSYISYLDAFRLSRNRRRSVLGWQTPTCCYTRRNSS